MVRPSGKTERIAMLHKMCEGGAVVHITQAARLTGASEITIRRDLNPGDAGLVCLGGYVMRSTEGGDGYTLGLAQTREAAAKETIAEAAARLIVPGDTIFLDCGTTTPYLARRVPQNARVTVVTQALNIANTVARLDGVTLIMLAGLYHPETASFQPAEAQGIVDHVNITKGFFSAAGVHDGGDVTCFHFHEVAVKRAALARAQNRYLLCDASKWGKLRPATYARLGDFDDWIGAPATVA